MTDKKLSEKKSVMTFVCQRRGHLAHSVSTEDEATILELALKNRIELHHSCGGMGSCGTCRILVLEGLDSLSPRNEVEMEIATDRCFSFHERLACQIHAAPNLVVDITLHDALTKKGFE